MALVVFHLDSHSGVPAYLQLVQQVRHAVRTGILRPGDQLPTVKEVVGGLTINPNTVLKAYRALEAEGLVEGRRGQGTFVSAEPPVEVVDDLDRVRKSLRDWLRQARAAGLDDQAVLSLVAEELRAFAARAA